MRIKCSFCVALVMLFAFSCQLLYAQAPSDKKIKEIGKEAEYNSNQNNLNYFVSTHFRKMPYAKVGGICSRVVEDSGKIFEVVFIAIATVSYCS